MLQYFQYEQHLLTNSNWTFTMATLPVNQWKNFAKSLLQTFVLAKKDAAHIQNDLLYICLLKDFAY